MRKVCEHQFFGLDPIFEPISTLTFESQLDLSQIPESVSVFVPIPFEPNQSSPKSYFIIRQKVLNKITQELFLKIENWVGIIF